MKTYTKTKKPTQTYGNEDYVVGYASDYRPLTTLDVNELMKAAAKKARKDLKKEIKERIMKQKGRLYKEIVYDLLEFLKK